MPNTVKIPRFHVTEPDGWRERAVCFGHEPELWSVTGELLSAGNRVAVGICRQQCPVREECHRFGVESGATGVIYGGELMPPGRRLPGVVGTTVAAKALGVSKSTVRNMLEDGRLPGVRDETCWRIRRADLAAVGRG